MDVKKFLSDSKMGKMIARLLGKEDLALDTNGKPVLSEDEKTKILSVYGEEFLKKFEGMLFSAESENTRELFDAALAHARSQVVAEKDAIINQLRADITTLTSAPESAPAATTVGTVAPNAGFKADMALSHNKIAASFNKFSKSAPVNPLVSLAKFLKSTELSIGLFLA